MKLNYNRASLFLFQSFMWGNNITSLALNDVQYGIDNNIDSATRPPYVVTHGITDKVTYLSETTK